MDENVEKKSRRPRIGENKSDVLENNENRYEMGGYSQERSSEDNKGASEGEYVPQSNYNQRNYGSRQGGYNNRQQGGYNRQGGYNNRQGGYNNRQQGGYNRQGGYNNRQGGYNRPYNNNPMGNNYEPQAGQDNASFNSGNTQEEGFVNNNRQGGYNQRGYNNNHQGGYNNRQGGYNNNRQQGGYNNNRQGGYNQRGGYNNNRQGGYNNNRQGGYNNNRQQGMYRNNRPQGPRPQMRFTPRPQRIEYVLPEVDPNEPIRLNKYMANAGVCSRREADELIQQGAVKVNGTPVTELGTKITRNDVVEYNDKVVTLESKCYVLLNKPKDCVTTSDDPNGRTTVMDLVKGACPERIYPVGRLDRNTTGVLLLTNDGDLASKLTHPKYVKKKIYQVWTDKPISEDDMQRIADGIELDDGPIHADAVSYVSPTDRKQAGIEIHSGRNRVVRRIFETLGYHVVKLDRVYFAGLTKKNLSRGKWRYLTQEEVNFLKQGSFE